MSQITRLKYLSKYLNALYTIVTIRVWEPKLLLLVHYDEKRKRVRNITLQAALQLQQNVTLV